MDIDTLLRLSIVIVLMLLIGLLGRDIWAWLRGPGR